MYRNFVRSFVSATFLMFVDGWMIVIVVIVVVEKCCQKSRFEPVLIVDCIWWRSRNIKNPDDQNLPYAMMYVERPVFCLIVDNCNSSSIRNDCNNRRKKKTNCVFWLTITQEGFVQFTSGFHCFVEYNSDNTYDSVNRTIIGIIFTP